MRVFISFVAQFKSPLILILVFASFFSVLLGRIIDSLVILSVIIVNSFFGTFWELKAKNALEALKKYLSPKAKILIEGKEVEIDAGKLKPGDAVLIESGDRIPADGVLSQASTLKIDEGPLTGESLPVEKKSGTKVFAGTLVLVGSGVFRVEKVGEETEIGKIAKTVASYPEVATPLQRRIAALGKFLAGALLGISAVTFIIGAVLKYDLSLMFTTAVALAVASVPEGLPIAVTVVLAFGVARMAAQKAIVAKLASVEALGSVTVIATDKTGTLTKGEIQATKIYLHQQRLTQDVSNISDPTELRKILTAGVLCNDARLRKEEDKTKIIGDPIEAALLILAEKLKFDWHKLRTNFTRVAEFPFDPKFRYMATLNQVPHNSPEFSGKQVLLVKGAPAEVVSLCNLGQDKDEILRITDKMAKSGLRILAFALKQIEKEWEGIEKEKIPGKLEFLGLVGFADEVRPEASETVKKLEDAGVKLLMVTGDHQLTAVEVAKQTGILDGKAVTWTEKKPASKILNKLKDISVLARVPPTAKMSIVKKLQENGEIVAMTGDGVNDGPALVSADIGVALGEHGTDVAKDAADIVLTDDNLATLHTAVISGRTIFENIRKIVVYLLSGSFGAIILTAGAILTGLPLPLLPAQILWINLVTDSLPDIALAFEPVEPEVLNSPPDRKSQVLTANLKLLVFIIAVISGGATLILFISMLATGNSLEYVRTITFAALGTNTLVYIFSVRSLRVNIWEVNFFSNKFLLASIVVGFAILFLGIYFPPLQLLFNTTPLKLSAWLIVGFVGLLVVFMVEMVKTLFILNKNE